MENQIEIYENKDGVQINVLTDGDTVWLNRSQLAQLFNRDVKTIGKHVSNALEEELSGMSTVAKFATVQMEGNRKITRQVEHYNLDMILSVGYRVKSNEGIQFRRWVTTVLKQYMIRGYAVNRQRLTQLNQAIEIIARSENPQIAGLADVLQNYSAGLDLLDEYDHQNLAKPKGDAASWILTYEEARAFINSMKFNELSDLFGQERGDSFKGSLGAIYQTFGGLELYPSIQEKAANLLYFVVKNHSFTDGNKRIAAALFVYFLDKNSALRDKDDKLIISNNALAAITLMIALSKPEEKEIMCSLVMNMLNTNSTGTRQYISSN
jgi:prophage maintenance system killer protein/prophage antirepressor-like protein